MFPVLWSSDDRETKGELAIREKRQAQLKAEAKAQKKAEKAEKEAAERRTSTQSSTSSSSNIENARKLKKKSSISSFAQNIGKKLSTSNLRGSARLQDTQVPIITSSGLELEFSDKQLGSSLEGKVLRSTAGSQLRDSSGSSQLGTSGSENIDSSRPSSKEENETSRYIMLPLQLPPHELTSPGNREEFFEPLTACSSVSSETREPRTPLEFPKLLNAVKLKIPGEPNQVEATVTGQVNGRKKTLMTVKQVTEVSYSPRPQLVRDEQGNFIGLGFESVSSQVSPVPTIPEEDEDQLSPLRLRPAAEAHASDDSSESSDSRPVSLNTRSPLSLDKWRRGPNTASKLKKAPTVLSQDKWDPPQEWDYVPRTSKNTQALPVDATKSARVGLAKEPQRPGTHAMSANKHAPAKQPPVQLQQPQTMAQNFQVFQEISPVQQFNSDSEPPSWPLGNGAAFVMRGETSLQRIIRQMNTSSVKTILTALNTQADPCADGEDYKKMEIECQLWAHRGLELLMSVSSDAHKVDRRGLSAMPPNGQSKVLSLHESQGEAAILATLTEAQQTFHLSTLPIDPSRFKEGTVVSFTARSNGQKELGYPANMFSMVQSLALPTLARSHEIPYIIRQCRRVLLPHGKLCLTIIDAVPILESTGPLLREWLETNLLVHLKRKARATHPSRMIQQWLQQGGFIYDPMDGIHLSFPAAMDLDSMPTPDTAALCTEIGRRLWKEVWRSYVAADHWWWDDSEILKECTLNKTRWVCHIFDCVKHPSPYSDATSSPDKQE